MAIKEDIRSKLHRARSKIGVLLEDHEAELLETDAGSRLAFSLRIVLHDSAAFLTPSPNEPTESEEVFNVACLLGCLLSQIQNGTLLPHAPVSVVVNEDFADLDYLDVDGPDGGLWLCGTSDEHQATAWTTASAEDQPCES